MSRIYEVETREDRQCRDNECQRQLFAKKQHSPDYASNRDDVTAEAVKNRPCEINYLKKQSVSSCADDSMENDETIGKVWGNPEKMNLLRGKAYGQEDRKGYQLRRACHQQWMLW